MLRKESLAKRNRFSTFCLFVAFVSIAGFLFPPGTGSNVAVAHPVANVVAAPSDAIAEYSAGAAPEAVAAAPLGQYGFESGTTQGWAGRGSAVLTVVTETARSGVYSLKVVSRTATWNGPSLNVLGKVQPNGTYEISGCVRLVAGQAVTQTRLVIGMERTPTGGSTTWDWVAFSTPDGVTADAWTCLQRASYSFTTTVSALNLYVEAPNSATVEFYVDDITINMVTPPPAGTIVAYNFEDSTTQGWSPRGPVALTAVTQAAHSGSYSLKTTGRRGGWQGPSLNVLGMMLPDNTYTISGCVRLVTMYDTYLPLVARSYTGTVTTVSSGTVNAPSAAQAVTQTRLIISMARTPTGGSTAWDWIAPSTLNGVTTDGWTCLQGQYTFAGPVSGLTLYVEAPNAPTAWFYLDDFVIALPSLPPIQTDIPSVYQTYYTGTNPIIIGAAIEPSQLDDARHAELLTRHFNSLTAENAMKPGPIHPAEGTWNWAGPDQLAQFARDNNMFIHGHTLEWHQQNADWMFLTSGGEAMTPTVENQTLLLQRLTNHIISVTERYSDVVNVWDVVNEVIDPAQIGTDCLRRNNWYTMTGMAYITTAFQVAYQMDPSAQLILNDYGTTDPQKRLCITRVVSDLLSMGVPINGIGMQKHINIENPSAADIATTIDMFASLGVKVHITELDMSIYTSDSQAYANAGDVPQDLLIRQGHRYRDLFNVISSRANVIGSVTFWGMADDHTWLTNRPIPRVDLPLLFDQQLQAKYAYWGIIDPSRLPPLRQRLNAPGGTPVIDGSAELLWAMLPWAQVGATGALTASFQTRWDQDFLYLFVDVEDVTPDATDAVDIFIDEGNDKLSTYGSDDYHYMFQNGVISPSTTFSVSTQADGYQLEAAFPFSATATVGDLVGFDVRVTDGSQPGAPISWNDLTHNQEISPSNFGTLTLIDAYRVTTAISGTPTIDAVEDPAWAGANVITTNVWVLGSSGSTAAVKTMYDATHLYVYAVVNDSLLSVASSNAWEQDSIEVFVDQNNAKTVSYQPDDGQFRVNYLNAQSFRGDFASTATLTSAAQITGTGYVVELAITFNAISPTSGMMIGFDFQVNNDQDGDGDRDSVVVWNDPTGQSYQNTSRIGVLVFQ